MATSSFKVKALFEYTSPHEDDLSFPNGQVITVTEEEDDDWYVGEYTDSAGKQHSGLFPKNFVEKYEPEIPTRPTRAARPKSQVQSPPLQASEFKPDTEEPLPQPVFASKQPPTLSQEQPVRQEEAQEEPTQQSEEPRAAPPDSSPKPKPDAEAPVKKSAPPVAAKSNAFKDRIAAFNKQSDAPVLPFKPAASSNYAVKKPFVAPPPSRDAYVPPPKQEPIPKIYRREEDPEIAARQAEDLAAAESAGLATSMGDIRADGEGEDEVKPQSLKERIALLQKQQAEQAQRRADSSSKEKPKRPTKKPTDPSDQLETEGADTETSLPVRTSHESSIAPTRTKSPTPLSRASTHDILSDGNEADLSAAGETTEAAEDTSDQEELERQRTLPEVARANRAPTAPTQEADVGDEEGATEEQSEASEEDEMDAEARRKQELRERMAKISGGMGMAGMFGGPQPGLAFAPPKPRPAKSKERSQDQESTATSPPMPPRAMVPVPGMAVPPRARQTSGQEPTVEHEEEPAGRITNERPSDVVPDIEDVKPVLPPKEVESGRKSLDRAAPPIPGGRPAPAPPVTSPRVPPLPPTPRAPTHDTSDVTPRDRSLDTPRAPEPPSQSGAPPVPAGRPSMDNVISPPAVPGRGPSSYFPDDAESEASVLLPESKRISRGPPPPVPGGAPTVPGAAASRPPPPPPPTSMPAVEDPDEGGSEYEGDYDTDIGSSEKHKAALKSHARQPSLDDSTTADDQSIHKSPAMDSALPPATHRAAPPPIPAAQPGAARSSSDMPRAAPPPLPTARAAPAVPEDDDDEDESFETYKRYQDSSRGAPPPPPTSAPVPLPIRQTQQQTQDSSDDLYDAPPKRSVDVSRTAPPPPVESLPRTLEPTRRSIDINRGAARKSGEMLRTGNDDFIATDIDLAESSQWWTQPELPPPVFQNRADVLFEIEESSTSKRGGKTTISKDVYVLFHDYSQTVVTARYDKADPADVHLEQRHEPPPPKMRQDQLEAAWAQYGAKIAEAASSLERKKDKDSGGSGGGFGDGSPGALALELMRTAAGPATLLPVGTRSYGALVYANIGNASVQQFDEMRPGDMITFRNARLQGKHGGLHQKYSLDVGATSSASAGSGGVQGHVAVVLEWDGTKKKVRAVEQVRDDKGRAKIRGESYKLGDLKSGEVKVWRVVGREWVGWDGGK